MQALKSQEVLVQPLEAEKTAKWRRTRSMPLDESSPEVAGRKVRALLNKLTFQNVDLISDQVIDWVNQSEDGHDDKGVHQLIITLIFEQLTDRGHWPALYAKLCQRLIWLLSPNTKDNILSNTEGPQVCSAMLFQKHLLSRCQQVYERFQNQPDDPNVHLLARHSTTGALQPTSNEKSHTITRIGDQRFITTTQAATHLSETFYASQKAKRRRLAFVQFIGELFNLKYITESILHGIIRNLLKKIDPPEERHVEILCCLMMTTGRLLEKHTTHTAVYIDRMTDMARNLQFNSRARFMIMDVIEMRNHKWVPARLQVSQPAGPLPPCHPHTDHVKEKFDSSAKALAHTVREDNLNPPSPVIQSQPRPPDPIAEAIALMARMFLDHVSTAEYVQFIQVIETRPNAKVFLSLASTTNPHICRTWLVEKYSQI